MKKLLKFAKRYRMFLMLLGCNLILTLVLPDIGLSTFSIALDNVVEMIGVIPPIFVLLGLLDVWVEKETMMRFLGNGSGLKGAVIAFALGAAAAGPLYGAFPVATVMMKKGASLSNVFLFVGAWSTAKIPLLTFEATSLGLGFAGTRLLFNLFGIVIIAWVVEHSLKPEQQQALYDTAMADS